MGKSMSNFQSDKCSKEELRIFKTEVLKWLNDNFNISKFKIKSFMCYNGEVRLYDGSYMEFENKKSSFRKNHTEGNKIIGTRGHHISKFANYIIINRDEFSKLKKLYKTKKGDEYDFYNNLVFKELKV